MMDTEKISQHISQKFNDELENIRERVMAMGGLVESQVAQALDAFANHDESLASKVIENDKLVNSHEVDIDEECARILAKRQPAAGDLRLVVAIIKTITDLERVGDEAEKIARMGRDLAGRSGDAPTSRLQYGALMHLGQHVRKMLNGSLDAFARMDIEAALDVIHLETQADQEYEAISRQLITYMMEDPRSITSVLDFMWSARSLERIGDHANNICEYVIYLVQGKDVRHLSLDEMRRLAKEDR